MSSKSRKSRIEVEDIGEVAMVNFIDRKILDEQNMQAIEEDLLALAQQRGAKRVVLNFQNVEYLSSAMLSGFKRFYEAIQAADGGKLVLCNLSEDVFEVFEITQLDRFFNLQKDEQSALSAL